ncbi:TetR family transcriptional regulator C-terminal domain-containing protein [Streptomyces sp. NPDC059080]|uniref:TetR family transcriptional regulator C-terminal domain-containing protein n=1 Tax=Streptomyces sp. NPDC059080 TaxID=3346718 RepID=UPI0036976A92
MGLGARGAPPGPNPPAEPPPAPPPEAPPPRGPRPAPRAAPPPPPPPAGGAPRSAFRAEGASDGTFRRVDAARLAPRIRALLDGFATHLVVGLPGTDLATVRAHVGEFLDETLGPA